MVFFVAYKSADCLPIVSALQTTPHGQGITIIHVRKLQSGAAFVAFLQFIKEAGNEYESNSNS